MLRKDTACTEHGAVQYTCRTWQTSACSGTGGVMPTCCACRGIDLTCVPWSARGKRNSSCSRGRRRTRRWTPNLWSKHPSASHSFMHPAALWHPMTLSTGYEPSVWSDRWRKPGLREVHSFFESVRGVSGGRNISWHILHLDTQPPDLVRAILVNVKLHPKLSAICTPNPSPSGVHENLGVHRAQEAVTLVTHSLIQVGRCKLRSWLRPR